MTAPYALFGDNNGNYKAWQDVLQRPMGGSCSGTGYHHCAVWVNGANGEEYTTFFRFRLKYDDIRVQSFTLMNAVTNQPIQTLMDGDVLDLSQLPTNKLNIRANTHPAVVGSVVINDRIENGAPYAFYGDNNGNYNSWTPSPGVYQVNATPYNLAQNSFWDSKGVCGIPLFISFEVKNSGASKTSSAAENADTESNELQIFPNPNEGNFTVSFFGKTAAATVHLMDMFGKVIYREEILSISGDHSHTLNLNHIAEGVYIVKVQYADESFQKKIIVSRR